MTKKQQLQNDQKTNQLLLFSHTRNNQELKAKIASTQKRRTAAKTSQLLLADKTTCRHTNCPPQMAILQQAMHCAIQIAAKSNQLR
jgi:hypothetical protein